MKKGWSGVNLKYRVNSFLEKSLLEKHRKNLYFELNDGKLCITSYNIKGDKIVAQDFFPLRDMDVYFISRKYTNSSGNSHFTLKFNYEYINYEFRVKGKCSDRKFTELYDTLFAY